MGRRDCLTKKIYLVGSPKVGGAGDGKHKTKYGHPYIKIKLESGGIEKIHHCGARVMGGMDRANNWMYQGVVTGGWHG